MAESDEPPEWKEARQWAKRNNFPVFEDYPSNGALAVKVTEFRYVVIDRYGTVDLMEMRGLTSGEADLSFGEKQLTVTEQDGTEHHISQNKFPL